jgi:fructan beta-fructosidase
MKDNYQEQFRPQFHFSPKEKWMNDPNGLVYNNGVYHLFYQYYPKDIVWGPMHWGHAISEDLIVWKHKPIALYPDELGDIFSGSVVFDVTNSSGLGDIENPPLVAIFTYHLMEGEKAGRTDYQTQGIAFSIDNGDTWTKYNGNPIIDNTDIKDFRDPKVFWHEDSKQWIMSLVAGDHAKFYKSDNLKNWTYLSDFGKEIGAHGGVWECPDLFKLKVKGISEEKWVLLISINPGAPNGGSGTQYFVGNFDGERFIAEHNDIKWIDVGADNYAGITYNNTPNDKRIFIGWMSNWFYGQKTPTKNWRSAMTLPRELSLIKEDGHYFLRSNVINSFNKQVSNVQKNDSINLEHSFNLKHQNFNQTEIKFIINLSKGIQLEFKNGKDECLIFEINPSKKEIILDRRKSGLVDFENRFADSLHILPYRVLNKEVDVRIILDWSSIELFIDNGKYVMTEQIFPTEFYNSLKIYSNEKIIIKNLYLNKIKSIWK